jgi:uncharacterized metal-binding protein YceD (DUF177 family)
MAGMTVPEFSRAYRLDTLGDMPRVVTIEANEAERAALAKRFGLIALDELTATAELMREGDIVTASGRLTAHAVQPCVASGEPVPERIAEDFALRFVPDDREPALDEIELSEGELDELTHDGNLIDLGEAAAQTLALALDPFPRAPDAEDRLREAGVVGEEDVGPFAALKALKDKL